MGEKTRVKQEFRYWKDRAERFESLYHLRSEGIEKILHEIYPYLKRIEGHIVDVGCGTGIPDSLLRSTIRKNVVGIDFSPSMLREALSKERLQYLVQTDALHLAFPKNSLGAIICITVLTDYTDKKPFYHEFYSCLRNHGIYIHGDYSLSDGYWNLNESTYPLAFSSEYKLSRESAEDTKRKLVEERFTVLKSVSINFKVPMTLDNYLQIVKSRPGFRFDSEKEEQIRRIAKEYLIDDELDRELILVVSEKSNEKN